MRDRVRVLHVEVGGSYGGSLRALDIYLKHSDRARFEHDLLMHYPTPGVERLRPGVGQLLIPSYMPGPLSMARPTQPRERRPFHRALSARISVLTDLHHLFNGFRAIPFLTRAASWARYDVVHVNNTFTYGAGGVLAGRRAGRPLVVHVRNSIQRNIVTRSLARQSDCVVAIHAALGASLRAWQRTPPIVTCYDPVETPAVDMGRVPALRNSLAPRNGTLIGSVGRLESQKGFEDFIRAASEMAATHPDAHFAIAGDGPLRSRLEALITALGLETRFHLCGFQAEIGTFIRALDVFVSSSRWEGLPLAVVEAMLLGVPVVATAVDGTPEVVLGNRTGVLVPPGNAKALAHELRALLEQPEARGRFVGEARRRVSELTEPAARAQDFDRILERLTSAVSGANQGPRC